MRMVPMFLKKIPLVFMLYPDSKMIIGSNISVNVFGSNTAVSV